MYTDLCIEKTNEKRLPLKHRKQLELAVRAFNEILKGLKVPAKYEVQTVEIYGGRG